MAIEMAVAALVVALVLLLASHVADQTVHAVGGMFRAPDLGWPSGVQEDDDVHWTWAGTERSSTRGRIRLAEPDVQDVDNATVGLRLRPLTAVTRR